MASGWRLKYRRENDFTFKHVKYEASAGYQGEIFSAQLGAIISSLEEKRLLEIQIPMDYIDVDSISQGEYACKNI